MVVEHWEAYFGCRGSPRGVSDPSSTLGSPAQGSIPGKGVLTKYGFKNQCNSNNPSETEGYSKPRHPLKGLVHRLICLQVLTLCSGDRWQFIRCQKVVWLLGEDRRDNNHYTCLEPSPVQPTDRHHLACIELSLHTVR